jgi:hypothetical protein
MHIRFFSIVLLSLWGCSLTGPYKRIDDTLFNFSARSNSQERPLSKKNLKEHQLDSKRFLMILQNHKKNLIELVGDQGELIGLQFQRPFLIYQGGNQSGDATRLKKSKIVHRTYKILAVEEARQDAHFEVTDSFGVSIKEYYISRFYLFPRIYLPVYENLNKAYRVLLPTGEELIFNNFNSAMLAQNVFEEQSMQRYQQGFPRIEYIGQGEVVRVDRKGHQYLYQSKVMYYDLKQFIACQLNPQEVFTPAPIEYFKFNNDQDFKKYIDQACSNPAI